MMDTSTVAKGSTADDADDDDDDDVEKDDGVKIETTGDGKASIAPTTITFVIVTTQLQFSFAAGTVSTKHN